MEQMGKTTEEYMLEIDSSLLKRAKARAQADGTNLSTVVEELLSHWEAEQSAEEKLRHFKISDEVKSLSERTSVIIDDAERKRLKDEYFKEKYGI